MQNQVDLTLNSINERKTTVSLQNKVIVFILLAAIEAVFVNPTWSTILGPVILLLLLFTYFVLKYTVFTTIVIVVANDALGTVVLGSLSFPYLLILFVFYELLSSRKINSRVFVFFLVLAAACGQLVFLGDTTLRSGIFSILYAMSLIIQFSKFKEDKNLFFEKFCSSYAIIVALLALHAVITGGIDFYEIDESSQEVIRKGILGVGIGDANFSALCLCSGLIGALNSKSFSKILRIALIVVISWAMLVTLSITGLIALLLVIITYFTVNKKVHKAIPIILLILAIFIIVYLTYTSFSFLRVEAIDDYIFRVEEKIDEILAGDFDSATSSRTRILDRYFKIILNENSVFSFLIGGNSIFLTGGATHNTYVDWLLRFGTLGLMAILAYIVSRFIKLNKSNNTQMYRKTVIMLKYLYLLFCFTLSIYHGATFGVMIFVLFFL